MFNDFLRISVDIMISHDITRKSFAENSIFCAEVGRARKHGPRAERVWCSGLTVIVVKWFDCLFTANINNDGTMEPAGNPKTREEQVEWMTEGA